MSYIKLYIIFVGQFSKKVCPTVSLRPQRSMSHQTHPDKTMSHQNNRTKEGFINWVRPPKKTGFNNPPGVSTPDINTPQKGWIQDPGGLIPEGGA